MQCHYKKEAPNGMTRGSATSDGKFAYFTPGFTSVYQYELRKDKWTTLPNCKFQDFGLIVISGKLTTVGGKDDYNSTNKLLTLKQRKWVEEYPPMKTARTSPATVNTSDGEYIIVIGGHIVGGWTATVELFRVEKRTWYRMTDLPLPQDLPLPSATIESGEQLNVIGTGDKGYCCSLIALTSNDQPITLPFPLSWKPLPPLPVKSSTAATLCGQLVIIGGWRGLSSVNSIHKLVDVGSGWRLALWLVVGACV